MSTLRALRIGLRRALSPGPLLTLWLVNLLAALPAAIVVGHSIREQIGASRIGDGLLGGLDMEWMAEYENGAHGLASTLRPSVLGVAAVFDDLDAWATGTLFDSDVPILAIGAVYALLWAWLHGSLLAHLSRPASGFRPAAFLARGAPLFFRFVRLAVLTGGLYLLVYRFARWLFPWLDELLREVTVERTVFAVHLGGLVVVVSLLTAIKLLSDYAKVATVAEDRRSMLLAILRGSRFLARHPLRGIGAYAAPALLGLLVIAVYAGAAPGAGASTPLAIVLAFAGSQLFLVARLAVRIAQVGAELEVFTTSRG